MLTFRILNLTPIDGMVIVAPMLGIAQHYSQVSFWVLKCFDATLRVSPFN